MRYEGMIYRPPSEAYSLIVQVTIGCSQNRCIFCSMFKEKRFRIRKVEEVLEDLLTRRPVVSSRICLGLPIVYLSDVEVI